MREWLGHTEEILDIAVARSIYQLVTLTIILFMTVLMLSHMHAGMTVLYCLPPMTILLECSPSTPLQDDRPPGSSCEQVTIFVSQLSCVP